jgi:hypothetical protein
MSPDFRVRVGAALSLARTKPPDARFVLERALDDAHPAVRAAVAAALAQVGDEAAVPALQKHLASESSGAVKSQLKSSIDQLSRRRSAGTLESARYVVQLGNMTNATNVRGDQLGTVMRDALKTRASGVKGVLVVDGGDPATVQRANEKHIPVILLDGTLTRLSQGASNGSVMVQAQVEFTMRKIPQQILAGTLSGAATTVDTTQALGNQGRIQDLQNRAVDGAVESAMRRADTGFAQAVSHK